MRINEERDAQVAKHSFDDSSHYGRRHPGYRGEHSTISGYDNETETYGVSTQYTPHSGHNSEYPSSGESERRKDRYYPYEGKEETNETDTDSVTAVTDMGHHGKEK